jgi:subtilisin
LEKLGLVNPTNEEQLSPEKGGPPDGLVKVLIGFKEKPGSAQQAMVKGVGGKIKYTYHIVDAIAASIPEKAIDALQKNPNVRYVESDGQVFALEQTLPWGVDRIDAEVVHASESANKGEGVKVAILDTGIDLNHPDLDIAGGENFSPGKSYDDKNGHGTHVAGIVAALDDGFGVIGVAPGANLYAVKVLGNSGMGWVSDIIAGLEWSVREGMQVVNMSLGGAYSETLEVACLSAYDNGLILITSAGNGGAVSYPAAYLSVIAVSATNSADELAWFSSTGSEVELAAPGVDIYSTYKDGSYTIMSGTSMAAPHVAGIAALVWANPDNSNWTNADVRTQLKNTAEDIRLSPTEQGSGLVDAENAVLGTTDGDDLPPTATGTISGTVTAADTGLPIVGGDVTANGYSTTTSADGSYIISDLSVGSYTVTASAEGYESASKDVTVEADTTTFNVDFALYPLSATGTMYVESINFSSKVAGPNNFLYTSVTVVDGGGMALEGVRVEMALTHVAGSWHFAGDTGTDGTVKFTLIKAPSGKYTAGVTELILIDYFWDVTNENNVISASCTLQDDGTVIQ